MAEMPRILVSAWMGGTLACVISVVFLRKAVGMSAADNPILNTDPATPQPERLLTTGSYSENPATAFARWIGKTGSQVRNLFTSGPSRGTSWVQQVRLRGTRLKDEHPVSLLGAMAGTAFALGVVTRVWRSRR